MILWGRSCSIITMTSMKVSATVIRIFRRRSGIGCSEQAIQRFLDRPETRRFLGPRPGADPAEEFGRALWGEGFILPQGHGAKALVPALPGPGEGTVSTAVACGITRSSASW